MEENRNEGCGESLQHKQTEGSEYGLNVESCFLQDKYLIKF